MPTAAEMPGVRYLEVPESAAGQRLDNFLRRHLKGAPHSLIYRIVRTGEVRVNRARARASDPLAAGDRIRIPPLRLSQTAPVSLTALPPNTLLPRGPVRSLPVLYEDEGLLVVDKPSGLAVHGGSGVSLGVIETMRAARPNAAYLELVHRLDRETSGVLMLAKTRRMLLALQDLLRGDAEAGESRIAKHYLALVRGILPGNRQVFDAPLLKTTTPHGERMVRIAPEGRHARTEVRCTAHYPARQAWPAETGEGFSLLACTLKTGRTHQIRVHCAAAGLPILGDDRYGDFALNRALARGAVMLATPIRSTPQKGVQAAASPKKPVRQDSSVRQVLPRLQRMFLHASRLQLQHPVTGEPLRLEAPLPTELQAFLEGLEETT